MLTYATQQDFENYVEGWVTEDPASLARLLERAERQVDDLLTGFGRIDQTTGLRIVPGTLAPYQQRALADAVCAQAEYRWQMGEEFFRTNEPKAVSGPDFSQKGRRGKIGDKVFDELRRGNLLQRSARM